MSSIDFFLLQSHCVENYKTKTQIVTQLKYDMKCKTIFVKIHWVILIYLQFFILHLEKKL